ncbi:glycoside hydrolase family 44 protein [Paenibacillus sp. MY03]|uniref:glycoside hydrolase family 44 protein n=1 Tax=Paenibacillus sp. MY03 TaxID=302980 RepID=UPI00117D595B|nr:glycoside hydrolase family 44 protein [Paenibacillus sp. MY03]
MERGIRTRGIRAIALALMAALLLAQMAIPGSRTFGSGTALTVFDDRLGEGFSNNSWSGVNLEETGTVREGSRSIRFSAGHGEAVYLYKDRIMNASEFEEFSFWVHGGGSEGAAFKLVFTLGGGSIAEMDSANLLPEGVPGNEWAKVTVPLAASGVTGWMDGILIWGGGAQSPIYLDSMAFTGMGTGGGGQQSGQEPGGGTGGGEPGGEEPGGGEPGPVEPVEPIQGVYLYDDRLAGFMVNYSWGEVVLEQQKVRRTGENAIRYVPDGDRALYLYSGNLLTVNEYEKLRFYVNGGAEGGQSVKLALTAGGVAAAEYPLERWIPEGIPANAWTAVEIDLAELQLEHRLFDGFRLTGGIAGGQPAVYIDDIGVTSRQAAQAVVAELRLSHPQVVMMPGEERQIHAETFSISGDTSIVTDDAEWSVDRPDLMTIDNGKLTALGEGIVKVSANYRTFTAEGYVQITEVESQPLYTDGLAEGYRNYSWHEKDFANTEQTHSGSRSIKFEPDGWDGVWINREQKLNLEQYYGFEFWLHGGEEGGQALMFHVYDGGQSRGVVHLGELLPDGVLTAGQWTKVTVNLADLGLDSGTFDGLILQAATEANQGTVYIDDIALLANPNPGQLPEPELPRISVDIDQSSERKPISNDIYGINFDDNYPTDSALSFPIERWGGNQTTRYNWQLDTANRADDWFYINYPYDNDEPELLPHGSTSDKFIDRVLGRGDNVLITVPTIGWTPKDRTVSYGFSQHLYGNQIRWSPDLRDAGNGVLASGEHVTGNDPGDTSVQVGPEFATGWINHIAGRTDDKVRMYALDNEPEIWHVTHRDVHPEAPTYDELWDKTVQYGSAIKAADPDSLLFGPVAWGWCGYFYSSADMCADGPDRQAHGGKPFLEWYLDQVKQHETDTGTRLIDYLDIHYYSQEQAVPSEDESPLAAKRRFQALKTLYDDNFVDQSWIQQPVRLIPRMKEIIAGSMPDLKLAITEYNFGNGVGITAGLAQAEALAIFGREGVDLATRFGNFRAGTPIEDAFKLYLDYDGKGSSIQGSSVKTGSSLYDAVGAYTIEGEEGKTYMLLFNKDTLSRDIELNTGISTGAQGEIYSFSASRRLGKTGDIVIGGEGMLSLKLPKRSATLIVIDPS